MRTRLRPFFTRALILWGCAISAGLAQDVKSVAQAPVFNVGDTWKFQSQDVGNKRPPTWFANTVRSVSDKEVVLAGEDSGGRKFWWVYEVPAQKYQYRFAYNEAAPDKRGRKTTDISGNDAEIQFPLEVGRKWPIKVRRVSAQYGPLENDLKAEVTTYEKIKTQAGEFDAFKIVIQGWWKNVNSGNTGFYQRTVWYAPAAKRVVKIEGFTRIGDASLWDQWTQELLDFKLQP
jgi:hypothetical protein